MGAMKKLGGRLQGNRSRESTSFITQGNTASGTNGNAQMVSTTAIADIITDPSPTTTDSSVDIIESTKALETGYFILVQLRGKHTFFSFRENKLLSMNTIIFTGLL